jgi:hypothetical protein
MNKTRLLNSAMMPKPGTYHLTRIEISEFSDLLVEAYSENSLISYIGYPQNIQIIQDITGIHLTLNRKNTELNDGDTILIMKLNYRPDNKRGQVDRNSFEYFVGDYSI